jgi:SAM-dependent methyltransferase
MKSHIAGFLICPACLPKEMGLTLDVHESYGTEVVRGALKCSQCLSTYPIDAGIASLHPQQHTLTQETPSRYENPEVVSSYLWSHYADLCDDAEVTRAYAEWAEQIAIGSGLALDAGCAVGRFTFELSRKFDFALGIDSSPSFIAQARKLLCERHSDFSLKQEGHIWEDRTIRLPEIWDGSKVEFIVADAQALPFRSDFFSCVASLNLVDKLPRPLLHLQEMSRAAMRAGAQLLFSDPFSWSVDYAKEEDWLGGRDSGAYAGSGRDNVQAILEGQTSAISTPWTVQKRGDVWWKIRSHRRHFELIRSCFIKAAR